MRELQVIHRLETTCICPVDATVDHYRVRVSTPWVIPVENIIQFFESKENKSMYQEELTLQAARTLNAEVTIRGVHSGVRTTCKA